MDTREKLYSISVGVTGRCNLNCSYCHYFKSRSRNKFSYDISDEQFIVYMNFIKKWIGVIEGETSFRFSGGEPMMLGDRLFDLADKAFEITGLRPFVLTAGKDLNQEWVKRARDSAISHVFVSIENPIRPDSGSVDPVTLIKKINQFDSDDLSIIPGVCVIPNDCYSRLYEICKWFYDEIGKVPLICEINYGAYIEPSEKEINDLENNLSRIFEDLFPKVHLNLFSSIVPEYAYGGADPYLFELNLENSHQITLDNLSEKIATVKSYVETHSYPKLDCKQTDCPWVLFCNNTKWYWQTDQHLSRLDKLKNYCRLKRMISDTYYRVLVDSDHKNTLCSFCEN